MDGIDIDGNATESKYKKCICEYFRKSSKNQCLWTKDFPKFNEADPELWHNIFKLPLESPEKQNYKVYSLK